MLLNFYMNFCHTKSEKQEKEREKLRKVFIKEDMGKDYNEMRIRKEK